jgi:hypothetical protein
LEAGLAFNLKSREAMETMTTTMEEMAALFPPAALLEWEQMVAEVRRWWLREQKRARNKPNYKKEAYRAYEVCFRLESELRLLREGLEESPDVGN